ncbi:MAG: hypothetical protein QNL61_07470 [Crocinitomicaceae bacterium]|mgnify:CR=1 FL=1
MSWTDEEIDNLAREGVANSAIEYKNEYWTEFAEMLPVSGKKDFLWFFTAFLFLGLLGTSFVFNGLLGNTNVQASNEIRIINESRVTDKVTQTVEKTEFELNEADVTASEINEVMDNNTNATSENSIGIKNVNNSKLNNGVAQRKQNSSLKQVTKAPLNNKQIKPSSNIELGDPESKTNQIFGGLEHDKQNSISQSTKNPVTENEVTPVSELPFRSLNEFTTSASLMPAIERNKQKLTAMVTLYIGAFGGISQSLIMPSSDVSNSFGLGIGAQIQKGRFTFTTGVNGVWSNHKDLNLSRSSKVYGFGSNEYNYQFKYKQIYSLEAEITAGYKLGRHLINVGARPSFFVGSKVGVIETIDDKKTIDRNQYGYMDGLYRFGIKPTIGYSFDITASFKIGVNIGFEMMSKIKEGFLVGNNNRYPIDGQLYLRKSIRFKR